ncbi:chemotaxis protein CheW [Ciceribacter thiooxidans]|uniref:Chemotaxis protein CheW n=1 Tax=Ciceribacter thiooxidans TaxID=1969821 RepID=A0ABV7HWV6_9HYPH|nr:chemotaxis protein CheW [Ciceribacter thiooxidans]
MTPQNTQSRSAIDWIDVRSRMNAAIAQTEALLFPAARHAASLRNPEEKKGGISQGSEDAGIAMAFTLAGQRFAIELYLICEVVAKLRVTPLAGAPPHLVGIHDMHGDLLPVFDLRPLLELPCGDESTTDWGIVVGASRPEFTVLCESIPEIIALAPDNRDRDSTADDEADSGRRVVPEPDIRRLDERFLLTDPRLFPERSDAGISPPAAKEIG